MGGGREHNGGLLRAEKEEEATQKPISQGKRVDKNQVKKETRGLFLPHSKF